MSLSCPVDLDTARLAVEVRAIYSRVAVEPNGEFHFHRGPHYAAERLGYDLAELAALPADATSSFAGVGNPCAIAPLQMGEVVVDIGCGAGMDLLLAARRVGPSGRAIGVDMTTEMLERADRAVKVMGATNVELRRGDALDLPVATASADVVISNGVLNLTPDKSRAFREIARILRPGGRLQLADIVVEQDLSEKTRRDIDLWTG
ncbi:MAG: methyltransferase domain-containing protein [Candidatus Schekmanbacteria bacterium]|nr:methyltransferase domain-containing protein [Candidatus Schekmanbacteria bacterium]